MPLRQRQEIQALLRHETQLTSWTRELPNVRLGHAVFVLSRGMVHRAGRQCFLMIAALCVACSGPAPAPAPQAPASPASVVAAPSAVTVEVPAPEVRPEPPPIAVATTRTLGWSTFHGNARRTGASSAAPIKNPAIRWRTKVGIQSWLNSPVIVGTSLVIVPSSGTHNKADAEDGVHALDFKSGKRSWHARFNQDANGVAANDTHVFATSDDGHLYALDITTGKVAWKQRGKGKMYSHPLLVSDVVVVGDAGGNVLAFAAQDGQKRWDARLTGAIRGGASADESRIYVASQGGDLLATTLEGKQLWKQAVTRPPFSGAGTPVPIEVYAAPLVTDDLVVVPFARDTYYTAEPALIALDKKTGAVRWRATGAGDWGNVRSTPALVDGTLVYGEPYSGDLVGIRAATGKVAYRNTIGPCFFPQWASPAAARSTVYLPRFDGAVYATDAATGLVSWSMYLGDAKIAGLGNAPASPGGSCEWDVPSGFPLYSPAAVADDGTLFVGTGEGFVYAIGEDKR